MNRLQKRAVTRWRSRNSRSKRFVALGCAVLDSNGATLYDFIDDPPDKGSALATAVAQICNAGIGPEWDAVSVELERRSVL